MSAHAFIAYLRIEAQHEEERARVLRALADSIQSGSTNDSKRAAAVKRKATTKAKPPKLTAYSLFIQQSVDALEGENHTMDHKDIISIAAHRWAKTTEEEKQLWQERVEAQQDKNISAVVAEGTAAHNDDKKSAVTLEATLVKNENPQPGISV